MIVHSSLDRLIGAPLRSGGNSDNFILEIA